jgi:catechol 2,3-dioxygenase-like lactoylglutathione lyase family enzyme
MCEFPLRFGTRIPAGLCVAQAEKFSRCEKLETKGFLCLEGSINGIMAHMPFTIDHLDHIVLTVADIDATIAFYTKVLGMQAVDFGERKALHFGQQKINLHQWKKEFEPRAAYPTPGSCDFCLITKAPLEEVIRHLAKLSIRIEVGPVEKTGAMGKLLSVYLRDPDNNLIEISNYVQK